MRNFLAGKKGIIISGALIGIIAAFLQKLGNPGNMGICAACFTRDISGALGLHRAAVVQYMRPEILGIILGAFLSAFMFKEFKPKSGSVPIIRFLLGMFAMFGALVFLGCPWRVMLRIAGGDINAIIGIAGLITGVFIGSRFFAKGYNPGIAKKTFKTAGLVLPVLTLMAVIFMMIDLSGSTAEAKKIFFYSIKGSGAMYAPVLISMIAGLVIGFLLQRSRLCTIGAFRDFILFKQIHLLSGVTALIVSAFIMNLIFGQFKLGIQGQPAAHTMHLWNFLALVLSGIAFTLAGGCPARQCVLAGEGDTDASVFVLGMLAGAAFAHNFALSASGKGVGVNGQITVIVGIVVCMIIGLTLREK